MSSGKAIVGMLIGVAALTAISLPPPAQARSAAENQALNQMAMQMYWQQQQNQLLSQQAQGYYNSVNPQNPLFSDAAWHKRHKHHHWHNGNGFNAYGLNGYGLNTYNNYSPYNYNNNNPYVTGTYTPSSVVPGAFAPGHRHWRNRGQHRGWYH